MFKHLPRPPVPPSHSTTYQWNGTFPPTLSIFDFSHILHPRSGHVLTTYPPPLLSHEVVFFVGSVSESPFFLVTKPSYFSRTDQELHNEKDSSILQVRPLKHQFTHIPLPYDGWSLEYHTPLNVWEDSDCRVTPNVTKTLHPDRLQQCQG